MLKIDRSPSSQSAINHVSLYWESSSNDKDLKSTTLEVNNRIELKN